MVSAIDLSRVHQLNGELVNVSEHAQQAFSGVFLGSAVYTPSHVLEGASYAVHGINTDDNGKHRFDKTLWRRRLSPQYSVAARFAHGSDRTSVEFSNPFASEHQCLHMRIGGNDVLQLVFAKVGQAGGQTNQLLNWAQTSSKIQNSLEGMSQLDLGAYGVSLEDALGVRSAYRENMIVLEVDLSGYKKESERLGKTRLETFTDHMRDQLSCLAERRYEAQVLQHQGDGMRIGLPLGAGSEVDVANRARSLGQAILTEYESIKNKFDPDVSCFIRVAIRKGEVIASRTGLKGFVLSDLQQDLEAMPRNQNAMTSCCI